MRNFVLAAALTCVTLTPAHAETRLFGTSVRMAIVPNIELSRKQRDIFKRYRSKRSYFGAFYVRPGTDLSGNTLNFHNLNTAKAVAKKECELRAGGKTCTLYAVTYPKEVNPNAKGNVGFGQAAGKHFRGLYKRGQKKGLYGAFALNKGYGHGISFGWKSAAEARAAAISFCEADSARALAPLSIAHRKWVRQQRLGDCKVVDTHTPK